MADPGDWPGIIALSCPVGYEDQLLERMADGPLSSLYVNEVHNPVVWVAKDVTGGVLRGEQLAPYRTGWFLLVYLEGIPWAYVINLPVNTDAVIGWESEVVLAGFDAHECWERIEEDTSLCASGRRLVVFDKDKVDFELVEFGAAKPIDDHPFWDTFDYDLSGTNVELPPGIELQETGDEEALTTATIWNGPNRLGAGPPDADWDADGYSTATSAPFQPYAESACRNLELILHPCLGSHSSGDASVLWVGGKAGVAADLQAISLPELRAWHERTGLVRRIDLVVLGDSEPERNYSTEPSTEPTPTYGINDVLPHPPTVALDVAIRLGHLAAARAALAAGAKIGLQPWQEGESRLQAARNCLNAAEMVALLLKAGADPNAR